MKSQDLKKLKISNKSGVYFWMKGKKILYIGKATSLKDRVKSYFGKDLINTRGPAILDMVIQADNIKWQETDSVLEALILEANLIKKYQPKYNTKEKDNKSFNYVCITKEDIPKVLIIRGRNLEKEKYQNIFGPFPNGNILREAMKIIRRIFPYLDNDSNKKNNREFYRQLGLVPFINFTSQKNAFQKVLGRGEREPVPDHFEKHFSASLCEYKNNIKNLKLFFQGKKKNILNNLKREMAAFSKSKDFENAARIRNQIFALNHINDIALIKNDFINSTQNRIEAYDIAHMSGKNIVGVMTVIENGEINKSEYKKFIVKTQNNANDTGALEEILSRRLKHEKWKIPNIIVVDGGKAQINVAKKVLERIKKTSPNIFFARSSDEGDGSGARPLQKEYLAPFSNTKIVSVVKDDKHKAKAIIGDEKIIEKYQKEILLANSESHRFAISFHKQKRNENFIKNNLSSKFQ